MTTIKHETLANCPAERVWALLSDLEAVQRYNPGVRTARIMGPQRTGIGARRVCDLVPRGRVVVGDHSKALEFEQPVGNRQRRVWKGIGPG